MSLKETKSVLDNLNIVDNAFPLNETPKSVLVVVGHCSKCGAPIYGPKTVIEGERVATQLSCACFMQCSVTQKTIEDQMRTT